MPTRPLQHRYSRFVRRHGLMRQFRHLVLWDAFHRHEVAAHRLAPDQSHRLLRASDATPEAALAALHTHLDGLDERTAARRRRTHGPNEPGHDRPIPVWLHLWHCYANPFSLLLTVLAVLSRLSGDARAAGVIASMVALSTAIRFVQEHRANRAADALKAMVSNRATVRRPGPAPGTGGPAGGHHEVDLPMARLVPGDIVALSVGDMVPADLRLLAAKDLFVGQAAMTGESLPVEKFVADHGGAADALARDNLLFMGTNVVSGTGLAVVVATGPRTFFGTLAQRVTAVEPEPTAFQAGINRVSWLLVRFMAVMVPLVLLLNGFTKGDWLQALLFALSIAVGLTPEMLPMIVTSTLARGAVLLSRQRVIVKRLDAMQNFGAMNVLCTDKTGTLTQDRIVLERHVDPAGQPSADVLRLAYLNSHYQTGLRNLLDVAVLAHVEVHRELDVGANYRKVDEIPFDFERRRMSVVVSERDDRHRLICKGAVDEVLQACTQVQEGEGAVPLEAARLAAIRTVVASLNGEGLRVVAVAMKAEPPDKQAYGVADEAGLTLVGFVAFLDPPKDSARPALQALHDHGVHVKVLTGDNDVVAAKVCRDVGLPVHGPVTGTQVDALDDAQLAEVARRTNLFARLNPAQKERIVRALRRQGDVVGFMGDGINDAPALRAADIGISVDSAVDIAKEAADIILLDKSLLVLQQGVVAGRRNLANLQKYLRMTTSSNFGNVLSVLVASVFLPFLPMLPLQLLTQNLLYDVSQIAIPFDHVDDEVLRRPQRWDATDIGRFMRWFGPVSSVFDVATFALMWFVFHADTPARQALFQSGWFVEGLLSQALIVHLIRTRHVPFVRSRAAWPVTVTTVLVMTAGIALVMGPLAERFRMTPLPAPYFAALAAILAAYVALAQGVKLVYARRYGWQ